MRWCIILFRIHSVCLRTHFSTFISYSPYLRPHPTLVIFARPLLLLLDFEIAAQYSSFTMAALWKCTLMLLRTIFFFALISVVFGSPSRKYSASSEPPPTYLRHQKRALEKSHLYKRESTSSSTQNISDSAIIEAQKIFADAVNQQSLYNTYRVANPRLNKYFSS